MAKPLPRHRPSGKLCFLSTIRWQIARMFLWIRYRWTLWKLTSKKRQVEREYGEPYSLASAEAEKQFSRINNIEQAMRRNLAQYLLAIAYAYRIPVPDDFTEYIYPDGLWTALGEITEETLMELKVLIRNEQKERWHLRELKTRAIVALLPGLTGALGVLIGLFAIIWRK
jgi:hypothetical protein